VRRSAPEVTWRNSVEEQLVSTPAALLALVVLAAVGGLAGRYVTRLTSERSALDAMLVEARG